MRTLLKKRVGKKNGKVWKVDVNLLDGNQLKVFEKDKKKIHHGMLKLKILMKMAT